MNKWWDVVLMFVLASILSLLASSSLVNCNRDSQIRLGSESV